MKATMKSTIDLKKVYDQVIYNIFSKIDGAEDLQKLIKTRNMDQLASMGQQMVNEWVEKIMVNVLIKETIDNVLRQEK